MLNFKKKISFLFLAVALLTAVIGRSQNAEHGLGLTYGKDENFSKIHFLLPPRQTGGAFLETLIDFQDSFPPPQDQGAITSCSSWATVYAVRSYLEKKQFGYSYTKANGDLDSSKVFSPLYIYNQIRDRSKRCDSSSSQIDSNLYLMKTAGVCTLPNFNPAPFSPYKYPCCNVAPLLSPTAVQEASNFKIKDYGWAFKYGHPYESGRKLLIIRQFLSAGYPVVLGIDVDSSFYHNGGQLEDTCRVWRKADNRMAGAHAIVCIGYNDHIRAIKILNSWGVNWANKGYGYIGEELIDDRVQEALIVNPGNEVVQIDGDAALSYGSPASDTSNKSKNYFLKIEEFNYFIRFRYQPYNNIRIMPVMIDENKNMAVFKVYEVKEKIPVEVDVFSLQTGQSYNFTNQDLQYNFKFISIKRKYGPFSPPRAYYVIKAVNK